MIKTITLVACLACSPLHANELKCLAESVYHEARGEPVQGQLAVAHVVLNRVNDPRFPDTVCAVINQRGQFHWTASKRRIAEPQAWKRSKELAARAVSLYQQGQDRSQGALFFQRSRKLARYHSEHVARIGKHSFFQ